MFDKKVQEMLTEIMFEEKAEKWVKDNLHSTEEDYNKAFVDGAEFGYNKANEWHYVKDRLPELNKRVLLKLDCEEKYDVGYLGVGYTESLWYTSNGEEIAVKVIKWKEIE